MGYIKTTKPINKGDDMNHLKLIYIPFILLMLLQGCSFDFLDDDSDENSEAGGHSEYDSDNDIKYYYNGEDSLLWMEYYDFDSEGQCIFMKHCLPSGTVLHSYVYDWDDNGNLVNEAYFDGNHKLSYYSITVFDSEKAANQFEYDENNTLQKIESWTYNSDNNTETSITYDGSKSLTYAYKYAYNSDKKIRLSSLYGPDSIRKAYIECEYDSSGRVIKKTGYGESSSGSSFQSFYSRTSFPSYGGVNSESRNSEGLTAPEAPEPPSVPALSLSDTTRDYSWMSLWIFDDFGYTKASLNSDYLPVTIIRVADDYLKGYPIKITLDYDDDNKLIRKTTSYKKDTVLDQEFSYNSNGYLTELKTSGMSLYIPLNYEFSYESGIPKSISILNEDTLLQKFVYVYRPTSTPFDEYAKNISIIEHYDGNDVYIGKYIFTYDNMKKEISIIVRDALNEKTGSFLLAYGSNDLISTLESYNASDSKLWSWGYSYDDMNNRIGETRLDEDGFPEANFSLNVESLFEELSNFLP
ncbi:MAG: hypothetical protein B6241_07520 [Spirochaetaceae bacterium 4572_59]|nr:MAG: hypothetical protein B6241_07520 [Spirochaetaceae bacterium 4572_59]